MGFVVSWFQINADLTMYGIQPQSIRLIRKRKTGSYHVQLVIYKANKSKTLKKWNTVVLIKFWYKKKKSNGLVNGRCFCYYSWHFFGVLKIGYTFFASMKSNTLRSIVFNEYEQAERK